VFTITHSCVVHSRDFSRPLVVVANSEVLKKKNAFVDVFIFCFKPRRTNQTWTVAIHNPGRLSVRLPRGSTQPRSVSKAGRIEVLLGVETWKPKEHYIRRESPRIRRGLRQITLVTCLFENVDKSRNCKSNFVASAVIVWRNCYQYNNVTIFSTRGQSNLAKAASSPPPPRCGGIRTPV